MEERRMRRERWNVKVHQQNLARRVAAHDALMGWLNEQRDKWILYLQEPHITSKGIPRIPKEYGAYWAENMAYGSNTVRAVIIAPREMKGYMISQLSSVDCVVVRFECIHVTMASLYCTTDVNVERSFEKVLQECEGGNRRVIMCVDTNAYHALWGSCLKRNQQYRGRKRGEELIELIEENRLEVCNVTPHLATFVRYQEGQRNEKDKYTSHIDVTMCTINVKDRVRNWRVEDEMWFSDHRCIRFDMVTSGRGKGREEAEEIEEVVENKMVKWKKPSKKMVIKMKEDLITKVRRKMRINTTQAVNEFIKVHTEEINNVLDKTFCQKGKSKKGRKQVYWWTEEVRERYNEMRKARKRLRRYKYDEVKEDFNLCRSLFRKAVQTAKTESWKEFTSGITNPWEGLVRIMKATSIGKVHSRTLSDLSGKYSFDMKQTLIILGKQFFPAPAKMTNIHYNIERKVNDKLQNERYEEWDEITMCELREVISEMSSGTAPGFDRITNNVIKILALDGMYGGIYVALFNICLRNGYFPEAWKKSKIVLIPKPSAVLDSVKAFRPISLTSAFAKLMERIVLARVNHHLAIGGMMTENQHAYRKGMSTQTALYEMFEVVQYAINRKEICMIVFLDISGAFDRTWHYGILHKLLVYGVPVYLVKWIKSFLMDRVAVFEEGPAQHEVKLEQGCPQGGVLSPSLWNVLFNEMLSLPVEGNESRGNCVKVIGYADDAAIVCKVATADEASKLINMHLNKIFEWSCLNRVEFNISKLAVMTISNKNAKPTPAKVYYNGVLVQEVVSYKYLGLVVDNKLTWKLHIAAVLGKLATVTRTFKGVARQKWGVKLDIFRTLYHSIFYPIMMYGVAIWGWKAMHDITCSKFDKAIRMFGIVATMCLRTTPNSFIFNLLGTQNFSMLLKQEVVKVSVLQFQLVHVKRSKVYERYRSSRITREVPQCMEHFYHMCGREIRNKVGNVKFDDISKYFIVHPAKWVAVKSKIMDKIHATWNSSDMSGWTIYSDASASSYSAGWVFVAYQHGFCKCVKQGALSKCSVYSAEGVALLQAVKYVRKIKGLKRKEVAEIRSDAQSLMQEVRKSVHINEIMGEICDEVRGVIESGVNIMFRWVPAHQGVLGNELVDKYAKRACDKVNTIIVPMFKRDVKRVIKEKRRIWGEDQFESLDTKFKRTFLPTVNDMNLFLKASPSVTLCQLVSGHTRLNDFMCNKIGIISSPKCKCGTGDETVTHYLFECPLYDVIRSEVWPDLQMEYSFITKDWGKLEKYVELSGRFKEEVK